MSQMERMYEIDRLLKSRRTVPLKFFMERLSVSRATVVRDLTYMKDRLRAPIFWDRELRGYRLDGPFSLPSLYLTDAELQALLLLHQLVSRIQPSFLDEHLQPLRKLLHQLLGPAGASDEVMKRRIRILQIACRPVSSKHFQAVCQAVLRRKRLHIKYYSRALDQHSERTVSPQRLLHYRDNWYMDAWCHSKKALRSFALDAIVEAAPVDEAALEISEKRLDRELGSGYGIFSGERVQIAVLRFSPKMARWISREIWHWHQEGAFEADGSYTLKVPFASDRELLMDIRRYGPEVEVLGPEELRKSVAASLKKTISLYFSET